MNSIPGIQTGPKKLFGAAPQLYHDVALKNLEFWSISLNVLITPYFLEQICRIVLVWLKKRERSWKKHGAEQF
jgi:hypothetical protein